MEEINVQITEDEKVRQTKGLIEETVKRVIDGMEKSGRVVVDPRQDPAFKAWQDSIATPMGGEVKQVAPSRSDDVRSIIRKSLESESFRYWQGIGGKSESLPFRFQLPVQKTADVTVVANMRDVAGTEYLQQIVEKPLRMEHVRDLLNIVPTSEGAIVFLRQTGFTNAAAAVAESVDPDSPSTLPLSRIVNTKITSTVQRIGHYCRIPYELLDDVDGLAAQLESQLIGGLLNAEDGEILRGDGTGENLEGLMVNSSCQTHSWSAGDAGDNQADAILEGIVKIWIAELAPDGIVVTPANAKAIMKLKDSNKQYLFPQFGNGMLTSLWGLPVVITTAQAANTVSVGAWRSAAMLRDRQEASIVFSDVVGSYRIQGLRAAIVEERVALVNMRPEAFCKITLDNAPSGS